MQTLKGAVALVTGASSGIGEGIAKMLSALDVAVALVAPCQHELQRVAREIHTQGGTALVVPADLRNEQALRAVVDQTRNGLGPVDILVNSGGMIDVTPMQDTDLSAWDAAMDVGVRAPTILCAAVLPDMRERKRGCIINITTGAGASMTAGMAVHAVSEHALRVLTQLIQQENQELGIKAGAICPRFVDTPLSVWDRDARLRNRSAVEQVVDVIRLLLLHGLTVKMCPEIVIRGTRSPHVHG